ncbi:MAG: hypothetical protein NT014_01065 [Candidatus Omnitrophica bacterium]|nr:hypothetical protein [Candidatus Omnitrophota bacterium]
MFIHVVLFVVKPKEVAKYRADSLMWARYTKKACGFLSYRTMKRYGYKDQYASVYQWAAKSDHDRFMRKYHDWLVSKSKAKVKVVDYYNLKELDNLR